MKERDIQDLRKKVEAAQPQKRYRYIIPFGPNRHEEGNGYNNAVSLDLEYISNFDRIRRISSNFSVNSRSSIFADFFKLAFPSPLILILKLPPLRLGHATDDCVRRDLQKGRIKT